MIASLEGEPSDIRIIQKDWDAAEPWDAYQLTKAYQRSVIGGELWDVPLAIDASSSGIPTSGSRPPPRPGDLPPSVKSHPNIGKERRTCPLLPACAHCEALRRRQQGTRMLNARSLKVRTIAREAKPCSIQWSWWIGCWGFSDRRPRSDTKSKSLVSVYPMKSIETLLPKRC